MPFAGSVSPPLPVVSLLFSASYPQDRRSYYLFFTTCSLLLVWVGGFTGNQGQKVGGFTGNQGQKVGGFTVDNWSESPVPVDKTRSGNRLGSPRNSFQRADGL